MKPTSLAVLGAGIAGLAFAAQASRLPHLSCRLFEKQAFLGGRVFSQPISTQLHVDLGANLIDFQNH
jgi:protoporphyrinogen oxidase